MTDSTARQTQSGSVSVSDDDPSTSRAVIAVALDCGQPGDICTAASLEGVDRVRVGRGGTRRFVREGRELHIELTDAKVSSLHAEIDCRDGFVLHDLGSTNGTFFGSARVVDVPIEPGAIFRVGQTFLSLVPNGVPSPDARATAVPWPFPTSHGGFRRELDRLERIAPSPIPVLLLGETGSGKEVLARATHERSGRPGPFVAVNCGALPAALVESLLFGHRKGAFSGATSDALGFVRRAHRGTLFLDEIGDLPLAAQVTLLRVLQEREVIPVGATEPERVDIRVLAATHRPLEDMVVEGRFRADLLSRLSGVVLRIPALRERRADLGTLIAHMLGERSTQVRIRPETGLALLRYSYPHNIRELSQAIEAALILSADGVLRPGDLPESMRGAGRSESAQPPARALDEKDQQIHDELVRRFAERGGNISQVARDMGKTRQQVQRWVRRFGLIAKDLARRVVQESKRRRALYDAPRRGSPYAITRVLLCNSKNRVDDDPRCMHPMRLGGMPPAIEMFVRSMCSNCAKTDTVRDVEMAPSLLWSANMIRSFVARAMALSLFMTSVGCADSTFEDEIEVGSNAQSVTTAAGPKLTLGATVTVPIAGVRSAQTHIDQTVLADGSVAPLQLVVAPTSVISQILALSGSKSTLTLGANVYDMGPWSPSTVVFPAVRAKTDAASKGNVFITIGFKPTELKYLKASGDVSKPTAGPSTASSVSTFDLSLGAAKSSPSTSIDAVTLDTQSSMTEIDLTVSAQEVNAWASWATGEKRDGTLTYTGPAGSITLDLHGVTVKPPTKTDSVQFYTVSCYTEHTTFRPTKTDI